MGLVWQFPMNRGLTSSDASEGVLPIPLVSAEDRKSRDLEARHGPQREGL